MPKNFLFLSVVLTNCWKMAEPPGSGTVDTDKALEEIQVPKELLVALKPHPLALSRSSLKCQHLHNLVAGGMR